MVLVSGLGKILQNYNPKPSLIVANIWHMLHEEKGKIRRESEIVSTRLVRASFFACVSCVPVFAIFVVLALVCIPCGSPMAITPQPLPPLGHHSDPLLPPHLLPTSDVLPHPPTPAPAPVTKPWYKRFIPDVSHLKNPGKFEEYSKEAQGLYYFFSLFLFSPIAQ